MEMILLDKPDLVAAERLLDKRWVSWVVKINWARFGLVSSELNNPINSRVINGCSLLPSHR